MKKLKEFEYEQLALQGMRHLNELHQLDILWFSPNLEIIHSISSHEIPKELGFTKKDYENIADLINNSNYPNYCACSTLSRLEYLIMPLRMNIDTMKKDKGFMIIGPYLSFQFSNALISDLMLDMNLPLSNRQTITHLYDSLIVVPSHFTSNLGFIALSLFNGPSLFPQEITYQANQVKSNHRIEKKIEDNQETIIKRYEIEDRIRHAVLLGNKALYNQALEDSGKIFNLSDRLPNNPLRSFKNIAIVFNTLMRIAAKDSGLHPIYVHRLSERFALNIENAKTRSEITKIYYDMGAVYIDTINRYSHSTLSPDIKKVIDYVHFNLENDLSLTSLATFHNMSTSNLANRFKNEMDVTVSDYVNKERIKEACYYLKHSTLNLADIGLTIGFLNQNYFSRMFKKYMNQSPSQYRKTCKTTDMI